MKVFLDTSSLFKLYHRETGTEEIEKIFLQKNLTHIYLSEITKPEFASTVFKKVRTKEISLEQANTTLASFQKDFSKYSLTKIDSVTIEKATTLLIKYGQAGLRTLDSIQLAACVLLSAQVDVFHSSDKLLCFFLEAEGLTTHIADSF